MRQLEARGKVDDGTVQKTRNDPRHHPILGASDADNFHDLPVRLNLLGRMASIGPRKVRVREGGENRGFVDPDQLTCIHHDGIAMIALRKDRGFGKAGPGCRPVNDEPLAIRTNPFEMHTPGYQHIEAQGPCTLSKEHVASRNCLRLTRSCREKVVGLWQHMIEIIFQSRLAS